MNHVTEDASRLDAELLALMDVILTQDPDGRLRILETLERATVVVARKKADLKLIQGDAKLT